MISGSCKCGRLRYWACGGEEPAPCTACETCGTVPTSLVGSPRLPIAHEFVAHKVETDDGDATLSRCRFCHRTRREIADAERRIAEAGT